MAVLEALERVSRGPAADPVRAALRGVAPSWLAQMPSLQTRTDAERLRRWHSDATPHRMLREFAGLVEAISIDHPLVLVLEDLHWSDHGTVDLISVLAQRPGPARMMLLGAYRPAQAAVQEHPIQAVLTLLRARAGAGHRARVPQPERRRRLSRTPLPRLAVAEDVVTIVHGHTDGNPLFMIALVDHLLARGWLAEREASGD